MTAPSASDHIPTPFTDLQAIAKDMEESVATKNQIANT